MSVPACVITGNLQNLIGAGTGVVKFTLVNPNVSANPIKVGGTALIDQLSFITSPGASFSITLWGLDVISPSNCYYKTEVFNSGGTLAWVANFNNFVGSGGDLSTLTAMNQPSFSAPNFTTANANTFYAGPPSGGSAPPTMRSIVTADVQGVAIVDSPTAPQTITGQALNLVNAPLTLDSASPLTVVTENVKTLNNVFKADQFAGANAGAKIQAAITAAAAGQTAAAASHALARLASRHCGTEFLR